jgi:hypothetical protein
MPAFSLTDAAFEGFRLTRERPRVVAAWALLYGLMGLITAVVMISTVGPQFSALQAVAQNGGSSDPAETMRQFQKLGPFFAIILPFVLLFWSVLPCAVYRTVLRPELGGFGRLRFGAEEVRMIGLLVLLFMLMVGTIFLFSIGVAIGTLVAGAGGVMAGVVGNLISLAALVAAISVWIRLSLAGPITFMTGEIHVFRSWSLTRGLFWPLVAAYALAVSLAVVITLLAMVIFTALAGVYVTATGGTLSQIGHVFEVSNTSIAAYFTPAQILYQAFFAVLQVVVLAVLLSPAAVIYAALSRRPADL